jgi:hypothetical protein
MLRRACLVLLVWPLGNGYGALIQPGRGAGERLSPSIQIRVIPNDFGLLSHATDSGA